MTFFKSRVVLASILLSAQAALSTIAFAASTPYAFPAFAPQLPVDRLYDNASGSPLLGLLKNAKQTLDIEIYQMQDSRVLSAVKSAVDRHVRVRIVEEGNTAADTCHVFEPVDSNDTASCVDQKKLVTYVRNHNGSYVAFNPALCGLPNSRCYQHGKLVIADGAQLLISTGNFNASSLCDVADAPITCNRDFSLVTTDPLVITTTRTIFENDLRGTASDLPALLKGPIGDRLTVSPYSLDPLVNFIKSAQKSVQIENQYLKDPTLNLAITNAAKKGVKVYVMVSSLCSFGTPDPVKDKMRIQYWTDTFAQFDHAGVHTRIFTEQMQLNGMPGYLHAKVVLVDGVRAWVGSVNGSTTSLSDNREYGLFTKDINSVRLLSNLLYRDFVNSNSESWQDSITCKKDYGNPPTGVDPPPESTK